MMIPSNSAGVMTQGQRSTFGLDVIALIFIPSYLVYANIIESGLIEPAKAAINDSQILSTYISLLILGSILSIERTSLLTKTGQSITPLLIASCAALVAGTACGVAVGLAWRDALFLVVFPIMSGGVSAGALPLSAGYRGTFGLAPTHLLAQLLPSILVGNFIAMIFASLLSAIDGKSRRASASANIVSEPKAFAGDQPTSRVGPRHGARELWPYTIAILSITVFTATSWFASHQLGISMPLASIVLAGLLHWLDIPPEPVRSRIVAIYRLGIATLTYPILIIVGLLYTPWEILIAGFAPARLVTIVATVATLGVAGYLVARRTALGAIDGGIVSLTRAAMGGAGDVIILSAARRLDLMPFAQIATRAGGAATIFVALAAAQYLGGPPR